MRSTRQHLRGRFAWPLPGLVTAAGSLGMGAAFAEKIYKWVDKQGVTQYSTTPPPAGTPATTLPSTPAVPADAASQAKTGAQRLADEARRREDERLRESSHRQTEEQAARRSAAERLQLCATAREQLAVVTRQGPVYRYNEGGERIFLEDSARDAEIARLRAQVARYCRVDEPVEGRQDAATRQRAAQALRVAQCNAARDALRALQSHTRIPAQDIDKAHERVRRYCATTP